MLRGGKDQQGVGVLANRQNVLGVLLEVVKDSPPCVLVTSQSGIGMSSWPPFLLQKSGERHDP